MTPEAFRRVYDEIQLDAGSPPGPAVEVWLLLANGDEHHGLVERLDVEAVPPAPQQGMDVGAGHAFSITAGADKTYIDVAAVLAMEKWIAPSGTTALNIGAAAVVKAGPGTLRRLLISAPGSAGQFTLNDVATVAGAAAGNRILVLPFDKIAVGQIITLDWPCNAGITVSTVSTGGAMAVHFD